MKSEIFYKGLNLVAENFQIKYSNEFSFEVWKIFKDIENGEWLKICDTIIKTYKYKPNISDYLEIHKQIRTANIIQESKEISCAECGKSFIKPIEHPEWDDWCPKCIAWRNSEQGKVEMKARIDRLKKRFENIGGLK